MKIHARVLNRKRRKARYIHARNETRKRNKITKEFLSGTITVSDAIWMNGKYHKTANVKEMIKYGYVIS